MDDNIGTTQPDRYPIVGRCEICIDGIAYAPDRAVCDACFDEAFESSTNGVIVAPLSADPMTDEEIFIRSRALYGAAKTRIDEWWARNEEFRSARIEPDLDHRFESACCRAIWRVLDSSLSLDEMAELLLAIDDEQARAEYMSGYNITKATIHSFHVRVGRLLKAALPKNDNLYRFLPAFHTDTCCQSPSDYDVYGG